MWFWVLACTPERDDLVGPLTVEIELRPGIHDLLAEATGVGSDAVSWSWTLDGEAAPYREPRIPAHAVYPGQRWEVRANAAVGGSASASVTVPPPPGGNVLVVVMDDVGLDKLSMYGLNDLAPPTPTLDALAAQGVVFSRAYASPTCTPTRAELLTGRHGRRTGAGWLVDVAADAWALGLDAITVPEALEATHGTQPWSDAFVGKWHLAGRHAEEALEHPLQQGFASFAGSVGYLTAGDGATGYYVWKKNIDGVEELSQVYNTTDITDDSIQKLASLPEPFLLWVAYNAAHVPLHTPPIELYTRPLPSTPSEPELYGAMLESMDTELGRLLGSMAPSLRDRTTIIVVGDNGTVNFVMDPGFDPARGKHTVYEGGIRVPLLVTGPLVAEPGRCDALVHVVDVFATLMEIGGVPLTDQGDHLALDLNDVAPRELDGQSLLPYLQDPSAPSQRSTLFAQSFQPNGPPPWNAEEYVLLDGQHKLIRRKSGDEFFALPGPASLDEGPDLLAQPLSAVEASDYQRLSQALDEKLAEMPYEGF